MDPLIAALTIVTKLSIATCNDTVCSFQEEEEEGAPTYEEVLSMASADYEEQGVDTAQTASTETLTGSPISDLSNKRAPRRKSSSVSRYKFNFKASPKTNLTRVKTPTVPAEVRAHIIRQCTMPSYSIMAKPQDGSIAAVNEQDTQAADSTKVFPFNGLMV